MGNEGRDKDKKYLYELLIDRLQEGEVTSSKAHTKISSVVLNGIALTVTFVWAGSFIADVAMENYNPPPQIHMVMLAIVGALFGFQIAHRG